MSTEYAQQGTSLLAGGRKHHISRRAFAAGTLSLVSAATASLAWTQARRGRSSGFDLLRPPDLVRIQSGTPPVLTTATRSGDHWAVSGAQIHAEITANSVAVSLNAPSVPLHRVHLRWSMAVLEGTSTLGDAWERSYGELAWLPLRADRVLPWYFLAARDGLVFGAGVKTNPAALAFWQVDTEGISLWLDVRNGGDGVILGKRSLPLATVVQHKGQVGESAWLATVALCKTMASAQTVVRSRGKYALDTIYGSNDWYYAYGKNTADGILRDADLMRDVALSGGPVPFCIVDDGYQDVARFPNMARLAEDIRSREVAPGIWIRPLRASRSDAANLLLPQAHWASNRETEPVFDPTIPEARQRILAVVKEACNWGYDFIKHDFTTYELLGQWGFTMGASPTRPGWAFHDRSQTNAEIIQTLYKDIRATTGPDKVILGCNTIGHLSVGIFDGSRTGDDVSGREWERTRRMGVNTLAFRLPQNRVFFATDADCVPITPDIPWHHTEKWLQVLAESGSILLVSPDPKSIGPVQKEAIRSAFRIASQRPRLEPLDWTQTSVPSRWKVSDKDVTVKWLDDSGATPFTI